MGRRRKKNSDHFTDIPFKANRVLNLILIGLALITLRVWHLAVVQHEERLENSRRPQNKVVIEPAKRGTIRDRFNIPLAINKVQYNAAVMYSQVLQIPSIKWEFIDGKKVKCYKRREHIKALAQLLGFELQLDSERIEDLIHSKAALYNNLPYVIKEDISEKQYYRLKMLEKDLAGIYIQCVPKRYYPMGKVGGDIIGYMGAISRLEYEEVIQEIKVLENCLLANDAEEDPIFPKDIASREDAEKRLKNLIEHAYSINDYVGKTGVEGQFEENLRGYHGKKTYYSDAKGQFLRELPGSKPPLSGQRCMLTLSSELQEFTEKLLIQNEGIRELRVTGSDDVDLKESEIKKPWVMGGAIVAMDPHTAEVLALSSYPRFNPNDFIASGNLEISQSKNENIRRWFETEGYIAEVWDQKRPLLREIYNQSEEKIEEEELWMTWENYLKTVLSKKSHIWEGLKQVKTLRDAISIQNAVDAIMAFTGQTTLYPLFNIIYTESSHYPHGTRLPAVLQEDLEARLEQNSSEVASFKAILGKYLSKIPNNYDKVLLIDLCRLIVDSHKIPDLLDAEVNKISLSKYREYTASWILLESAICDLTKNVFNQNHFKPWKEKNQAAFLKLKREEEKTLGIKYPKPYLDLLDKKEKEMFALFWEENRFTVLLTLLKGVVNNNLHDETLAKVAELSAYEDYFITWKRELEHGAHSVLGWNKAYFSLRQALQNLSNEKSIALLQSFRGFEQLTRPLLGKYRYVRKEQNQQLEKHLAAGFYPIYGYGYGRSHAYRQAATQGSIFKIVTGYEALSQKYAKINGKIKHPSILNPFVMIDETHKKGKAVYVGYDSEGKSIPQFYKGGRIPRSRNRRNLGKVDFVKAFEVSSNPYFSLLAGDYLENPNDLSDAAKKFGFGKKTGIDLPFEIKGKVPEDLDCNRSGLYSMAIGQHSLIVTPLQTAVMLASIANGGKILKPKIVNMMIGKETDFSDYLSIECIPSEVKNELFLPSEIRTVLMDAMERVSKRTLLSAWGSLSQTYRDYPEAISDLVELKGDLLAKSSTSESIENMDLDLQHGTNIYSHTWCGGIVCDSKDKYSNTYTINDLHGNPELVVVIYLRYGAWGKDTLPIAAQVAQKWREIKKKHSKNS